MAEPTQAITEAERAAARAQLGLGGAAVKLPPSIKIPPPTADPLQDAMNLQVVLANAINGNLPAEERAIAFSAYQATSDDVARLMKEREAWNAEQTQKQAAYDTKEPSRPTAPASSTNEQFRQRWDETQKKWVDEQNPNYVAPKGLEERIAEAKALAEATRAPVQGPSFPNTREGMDYEAGLQRQRDAEQSKLRIEENKAKDKAEWERLFWEVAHGFKLPAAATAEYQQIVARNNADYDMHLKRVMDAELYNRDLPARQAQEDRAARADQRERNAPRVAAFKEQAQRGQSTLDTMVNAGIRPGRQLVREAYDPYAHIDRILNEAPAQGPRLQPQAVPTAPTPRPLPPPPQFAPAAPGGPAAVAPPAPLLPEDQDLLRRAPS